MSKAARIIVAAFLLASFTSSTDAGGPKSAGNSDGKPQGKTTVVVDDVEYKYLGGVRNGTEFVVTLLATSLKGEHPSAHGFMKITDDEGTLYNGTPTSKPGTRQLREGVPVRLTWLFAPNRISKKGSAPSPSITRFALVSAQATRGGSGPVVEFRDVPATIPAPKD